MMDSDPQYCKLKKLYDSELSKLKELEVEYDKVSTSAVVFSGKEKPREIVKWQKMFRLMAELSVLETSPPKSIPVNQKLLLVNARRELLSEMEDLKSLEIDLREEKQSLLKAQSKAVSDLEEERQHLGAIKRKVAEGIGILASSNPTAEKTEDVGKANDDLENKIRKLRSLNEHRTSQLFDFLDTHFPAPNKAQQKVYISRDLFADRSETPVKSLKDIITKLIAYYGRDSLQPWIKLDSSYWPPHVHFLLESGIVIRKPDNKSLLKLETFSS